MLRGPRQLRTQCSLNKTYTCGEKGHFAKQCPNPRTRPQTTALTPALTRGANSIHVAAK
jgi:hypothetical protein